MQDTYVSYIKTISMHTAMLLSQMNIYIYIYNRYQGGGQYSFSSMFKFTTFGKEQCHSTIQ